MVLGRDENDASRDNQSAKGTDNVTQIWRVHHDQIFKSAFEVEVLTKNILFIHMLDKVVTWIEQHKH